MGPMGGEIGLPTGREKPFDVQAALRELTKAGAVVYSSCPNPPASDTVE